MPWKRRRSTRGLGRVVHDQLPPSIVVMFLLGWKLNDTMSPVPTAFRRRASRSRRRVHDHAHAVSRGIPQRRRVDGRVVVVGSRTRVRA
jgi:hypothetical protein